MFRYRLFASFVLSCLLLQTLSFAAKGENAVADQFKVGVAKVDVTPSKPVVLAGYGGRTKPFEGIDSKLWARAMVIERDQTVALVVLDNCGITGEITRRVRELVNRRTQKKIHVSVVTTHTHNAPTLTGYAPIVWQGRLTPKQQKDTEAYTDLVVEKMATAILLAEKNMEPMNLKWGQGKVTFGGNRRVIRDGKWQGFGFQIDAPVDHSLPLLIATNPQGKVRALWANYACHCTTVGSRNRVGGDWAGFANEEIEKRFPGAISMVSIGCGADVGPQPSGSLEIARRHGLAMAQETERMIEQQKLKPLSGNLSVSSKQIVLPLEKPATKSIWVSLAKTRGFHKELAVKVLNELAVKGKIADSVEYPIQTWKFSDQLAIVLLPGEVVVDYAVRLKMELDWERLWITGWANRMPGYIPSRKVLMQGGYEADFSQVYYGQPSRYRPEVEDHIVKGVRETVGKSFLAQKDAVPAPYHSLPSREPVTFKDFLARHTKLSDREARVFAKIKELLPKTIPAVEAFQSSNAERTQWFDFKGDTIDRWFIRQSKTENKLVWNTPKIQSPDASILGFCGGLGWVSQPQTAGFTLKVNGDRVQFDLTRKTMSWPSESGLHELLYVPTWTSNEDSAGFFFLRSKNKFKQGDSIEIAVESSGQDSLRWFAVDLKQTKGNFKKLDSLLTETLNQRR